MKSESRGTFKINSGLFKLEAFVWKDASGDEKREGDSLDKHTFHGEGQERKLKGCYFGLQKRGF